ncbi:P-loop containing nucleoside triphosphate hydrolase protein [Aspergillus karnatakaensis]|uniref:translation termination factor GTPase eRF3 n=1 Tax=Aspergillus karnatakaensis TaxID=1810916 RepID=UPI003CCDF1C4
MANQTPDNWEDELSRQTEGVNLNYNSRPQAQAPSFQPGAASFQPGANSFVPGQQFQQYGGYPQYGQYGQQQPYGQYQNYDQYGAYNQHPGGYNQVYNQNYGGYQQQQQFPQQPRQAAPAAQQQPKAAPAPAQSAPKPAANTAAPKAKVLSIGGASNSPSAPKAKILSIGTPTPASTTPSSDSATITEAKGPAAVEAAAKVTAGKAIDKTEKKAEQKAAATGKNSPTPSGRNSPGRSSPSRGETAKEKRDADAVAQEQAADVDEDTLKEIYGEKKEHVNIVFIGHVDAGKSTLGGSILYVTGMVDERTLDKYRRDAKEAGRETWYLSWALDLTNEERAKGKTVEVGRAHFKVDVPTPDGTVERHFSILDAPGHKSYVHHMIGGASQADIGVLVISARKGEYETGFEKGGQTREHALLARNTGVRKLVVAVNKMDDITVEWSKARFEECTVKVSKFLEALGYKKDDLTFMPISAQRTLGIKDRVPKDLCPWYDGPSLIEYLTNMKMPERNLNAPFMMPISAKYRDMGTVVEGRVEAGVIKKNQTCIIMPNRTKVEIAALYGETEDEIPNGTCGEQVRMRLRGVEEEDLLPGFVMCSPKRPVHCVSAFEAKIRILDLKSILTAGYNCVMHVHSAVEEVTVAALLHKLEPGTGRRSKRPPPFASKGQMIIARIEVTSTAGAVCVERFEDYNQMGRFTLRDQGQTVAIGMVTKLIDA